MNHKFTCNSSEIMEDFMKYYYEIDVIKRMISIYYSDIPFDKDNFILTESQAIPISFNDMIYLIEDYSCKSYQQEIKELSDMMTQNISYGKKQNLKVSEQYKLLCIKYQTNILARICLDILYSTYEINRNELLHPNFKKPIKELVSDPYKKAEGEISSSYKNIEASMKQLMLISENNFTNIFNSHKLEFKGVQVDIDNRRMAVLYPLTESFTEFNHLFINSIDISALKVYTCRHCQKRFFEDKDTAYCPAAECQEAKEKEAEKQKKANWQNSPYNSLIGEFDHYCDTLSYQLDKKEVDKGTVVSFKKKCKPYKEEVRMEISIYKDTLMPLPPEIEPYIKEQKDVVKKMYDDILVQLGIKRGRGRPRKK